jgi:hypothetical protein
MEARQSLSTREIAGDGEREEPATHTETDREPDTATARTETDREPDMATARTETDREPGVPSGDAEPSRESRAATGAEGERASTGELASDSPDLLPREENAEFQGRWETIQTGFVDEPRQTVEQADELVAQLMQRLAEGFAAERERLEQQWGRGEDVSTEDLRIALQRYRSFFQRLLAA